MKALQMALFLHSHRVRNAGEVVMRFKIERVRDPQKTTIRLIGRIRSEHLEELKTQIQDGRSDVSLDLDEVSLFDLGVVRFLALRLMQGVPILHCSPYIRDWIAEEIKSSETIVE
jgi:hypothetical protein